MLSGDLSGRSHSPCSALSQRNSRSLKRPIYIDFVHIHAVQAICDILIDFNVDLNHILEQAGLSTKIRRAAEAISFSSLGRLTDLAATHTQCAHFGLLVGQRTTLASLGLLGSLMRHSETVGDALRALETYYDLLNRGAVIEVAIDGPVAIVSYAPYQPETEGIALHCERAIAALTNVLRPLCGPDWNPDEVLLPRLKPCDTAPYTSFFRCPVRFEQEIAALVIPARLLRRPIAGAQRNVRDAVDRRIRQLEDFIPSDVTHVIRRLVRSVVTRERIEKAQIAQTLAVHKRTLTRRLKAEGTTFRSVANQTRLSTAKQLLADTSMSLVEISAALKFSEPAAFTHAFRRWTGTTPSAWRREHRAS